METIIIMLAVMLAITAGVAVWKLFNRKPKLTDAQKTYLDKIASNPHKDRIIGVPAYGLVAKYGENGVYGEKSELSTALLLAKLTNTYKGLYVLNNVQVTKTWDIDHLIIVDNVIILVDTKNWKGKTTYRVVDTTVNGRKQTVALRDNEQFPGNSVNLDYYMEQLKRMYPRFTVYGVLNIDAYNAMIKPSPHNFYVTTKRELLNTIENILGRRNPTNPTRLTKNAVKDLTSKTTTVS